MENRGLVDDESVRAVGQPDPTGGGRQPTLEADARRQPGKEQAPWRKDAPHLPERRPEVPLVTREMQDGAADDGVGRAVVPRKGVEWAAVNLTCRQRGVQGRDELAHRANRRGVGINRTNVEAMPQEERKVPSPAAACVEHPPPTIESSAKKLIEQVDVDLAELRAQGDGLGGPIRRHCGDDTVSPAAVRPSGSSLPRAGRE